MSKTSEQTTVTRLAARMVGGSLNGILVGVWGLTVDGDVEGEPSLEVLSVIEELLDQGALILAYDPAAGLSQERIVMTPGAYDAARGARLLLVFSGADEFVGADFTKVHEIMAVPAIIDARDVYSPAVVNDLGASVAEDTCIDIDRAAVRRAKDGRAPRGRAGRRPASASAPSLQLVAPVHASDDLSVELDDAHRWGPSTEAARGLRAKRAFDLIVGVPLALAALPLIALFAVGIAIQLRCWPFFTQWRTGKNGEQFRFLKIRTLPPKTPAYAHKFNLDTESLPKLARFLRAQHLDELPQLLLVPLGKMTLVGPRPKMPDDYEPIEATFGQLRTLVPQGCTGLWQVGEHAHLRVCDSADYDYAYLHHGGVRLDMWILWRTAKLLIGKNTPVTLRDGSSIPQWVRGRGFVDVAHVAPFLEPLAA